MKRIICFLAIFVVGLGYLTSCMEGGNVQEGVAYGVLGWGKNGSVVLKTSGGNLYSPFLKNKEFEGELEMDKCYGMYYSLNGDLPENAPAVVELNGYYTVTIIQYGQIPDYYLQPYLADTSYIFPNEEPLVKGYEGGDYTSGYFFIAHTAYLPKDWDLSWNISYDPHLMMPTEVGGRRYYDLFLRATIRKEGDEKTKINLSFLNAYYFGDYLREAANREREILGNLYSSSASKFTLRFNYVSSLDRSTGKITWKSDEQELFVASFLDQ